MQELIDSEEEQDIKNNFDLYSLCTGKQDKNPFFIKLGIHDKLHEALLDTGADISVINATKIPNNTKIQRTNRKVTSACGTKLNVIGKVKNLQIKIGNNQYMLDALVTKDHPKYIILGSPFIVANRTMLMNKFTSPADIKNNSINNVQEQNLDNMIANFEPLFQTEISNLTLCTTAQHSINTGEAKPISKISPWCSRIVPVEKKNGTMRMCIDYRDVNKCTIKDSYPIPRIDAILDALKGARIFSSLDATSGYYQIAMDPKDMEKTAFAWKNGLFEFKRMPFGLCNAPATFQRAMDQVFRKERFKFIIPYFDDIIVCLFRDNGGTSRTSKDSLRAPASSRHST